MKELDILLARQRADPGSVCVLPVWYGVTCQQCCDLEAVYHSEEWVGGEPKPSPDILKRWATTVRELLNTTAVRDDQVGNESVHCNSVSSGFHPVFVCSLQPVLDIKRLCFGGCSSTGT